MNRTAAGIAQAALESGMDPHCRGGHGQLGAHSTAILGFDRLAKFVDHRQLQRNRLGKVECLPGRSRLKALLKCGLDGFPCNALAKRPARCDFDAGTAIFGQHRAQPGHFDLFGAGCVTVQSKGHKLRKLFCQVPRRAGKVSQIG